MIGSEHIIRIDRAFSCRNLARFGPYASAIRPGSSLSMEFAYTSLRTRTAMPGREVRSQVSLAAESASLSQNARISK
jgi:hypothetical protein